MSVYLFNLIFVVMMSILAQKTANKKNHIHENKKLPNIYFVSLALISLVLVCGLRWKVGTDYQTYVDIYTLIVDDSLTEVLLSPEPTFTLINWISSRGDIVPQRMFFLCSVITTLFAVSSIRRYSLFFPLSIFLYITDMTYYAQFNGIRQAMASSIMMWGFGYLYNKQFKKYFLLILLASTIHQSALFFIPFYFIVQLKPWSKKILLVCILSIFIAIFFTQFAGIINILIDGRYGDYFDSTSAFMTYGVKPIRVIVAAVPVLMSLFYYKKLKNTRFNRILINISLLNFLFMFLATQTVIIARINMYLSPYNLLLIPQFLKSEKPKFRPLFMLIIIICYFIYMYILLHVDSHLLPYKTIFDQ